MKTVELAGLSFSVTEGGELEIRGDAQERFEPVASAIPALREILALCENEGSA